MCVDCVLSIGKDTYGPINMLEHFSRLKESSPGRPYRYLGANVEIIQTTNGQVIWSINFQGYMKNAIDKEKELV